MQMGAPLARLLAVESTSTESLTVRLLLGVYVLGAMAVLLPLGIAAARLARRTRFATPILDERIIRLFADTRAAMGVHRPVRLLTSTDVRVPMTWGLIRPAILVPPAFGADSNERLRAVLLHELGHVKSGDAAFMTMSRLCCAALWFNPVVWWIDRRLRAECELACDDQVLTLGVRQSDYAELLVDACERLRVHGESSIAMAISGGDGLRERLRTILDPARDRRRGSRLAAAISVAAMLLVAVPASMVQLAPTRSVLNSLMHDHRWQSRAYAVLGLAQRPDSIEVARSAATTDPDPKVRAWAQYAVSLEPISAGAVRAPAR
jgi:beta-lactamase regulating signal transducer with metallopeptidase domain